MDARPKTVKLLEEDIEEKQLDISLGNDFFFWNDTKSTSKKPKNYQIELWQTKKLLHSKRKCQQNEKATYAMGKNIYKPYI